MHCRLENLCDKDIINLENGSCLGSLDDVVIDTCDAKILSIVIYGRKRCFGLLGRDPDIIIPWKEIKKIGEDTILICLQTPLEHYCEPCKRHKLRGFFRFKKDLAFMRKL